MGRGGVCLVLTLTKTRRRRRLHGVMRKLPLNSMMAWMGAKNMQDKGLSGQENEAGHCSCYKVLDNVACLSI